MRIIVTLLLISLASCNNKMMYKTYFDEPEGRLRIDRKLKMFWYTLDWTPKAGTGAHSSHSGFYYENKRNSTVNFICADKVIYRIKDTIVTHGCAWRKQTGELRDGILLIDSLFLTKTRVKNRKWHN